MHLNMHGVFAGMILILTSSGRMTFGYFRRKIKNISTGYLLGLLILIQLLRLTSVNLRGLYFILNSGILFFPGNSEASFNYPANTYHFRQDSNFLYFFGLDHPDLGGVIDLDTGEDWIFGNDVDMDDIIWMGTERGMSPARIFQRTPMVIRRLRWRASKPSIRSMATIVSVSAYQR